MDDYQNYTQSGSDNQNASGMGGNNIGCGTIVWVIAGIVFLVFWYSNGGT